ncbi:40S ribosomal protein S24 [Thelohanellus kitauei]|uniref:Small ribosomal subunit protein eS24 n=1 Tax=Thelohanellus kitauei TaxID=669202 RepID=A0A0C2MB97_THEKT|nr:40S ribosomal protein S24 [Thelohanellus kitauei]
MTESLVTLRTRKFMTNPLLGRKQMVVDVIHPNRKSVSRADVQKQLSKIYKVDEERVVCYKMHIAFGGGKSTGLALIYDDIAKLKQFEPKYRQIRKGLLPKKTGGRKARKEKKNKLKKFRGLSKKKIARLAVKKQNRNK